MELAYLNLVEAGCQAILVYPSRQFVEPGFAYTTRGHDEPTNLEASKLQVPMVDILVEVSADLKRRAKDNLMRDSEEQYRGLHLNIESVTNNFTILYSSDAWSIVSRRLVPCAHLVVVAASLFLASSGGFTRGGTCNWVIFIEMMPALALALAS